MIAISLKFLAGRYHATPWGRHVNEGAVEWPPAPWRILRALVAAWKRTLPNLPQHEVEPILRQLATRPEFLLPTASTGHTRHFMPWFKKGPDDRALVFDTFVAVPRDAQVIVRWPHASLDDAQRTTLAHILGNLNTFGRSESWCEASLVATPLESYGLICRPLDEQLAADHEIVRLLCADPASAFADDRVVTVTRKTVKRGKKGDSAEVRSAIYDPAWNLCMETLQLHQEKWSDPPASCWVPYARPRECFEMVPAASVQRRRGQQPSLDIVRYAIDSTVLPLVTDTLPVAEAARRALMSLHGRITERDGILGRSCVLSGKDAQGQPLAGHRHAYYLPTDEDGDGRLDQLTIFARGGFDAGERRAFDRLLRLRTGRDAEEKHELRLLLLGMGSLDNESAGPLATSTVWESATPYIATRYAKTRGRHRRDLRRPSDRADFLLEDLREQVRQVLGLDPRAAHMEAVADEHGAFRVRGRWRPIEFKRYRSKRSDDGGDRLAGAFRIRFERPMTGPIALGHSAHFGMGLFLPAR
jgi:CRISPR-associated protein Csb2